MTVELKLTVNETPIKTDYFVAGFIDHAVSGMIEALEHTGDIKNLKITIKDGDASIMLNGSDLPINEFVTKIIIATIDGMVSTLKGVTRKIETLELTIKK